MCEVSLKLNLSLIPKTRSAQRDEEINLKQRKDHKQRKKTEEIRWTTRMCMVYGSRLDASLISSVFSFAIHRRVLFFEPFPKHNVCEVEERSAVQPILISCWCLFFPTRNDDEIILPSSLFVSQSQGGLNNKK